MLPPSDNNRWPGRWRRNSPALIWGQRLILLIGVFFAVILLSHLLGSTRLKLELHLQALLLLFCSLALSIAVSLSIWTALHRIIIGHSPPLRESIVGLAALMIGKYLPGKVFGLLGRFSSIHPDVPGSRAMALVALEQALLVAGLAAVALPILAFHCNSVYRPSSLAGLLALLFIGIFLLLFRFWLRRSSYKLLHELQSIPKKRLVFLFCGLFLLALFQAVLVSVPAAPLASLIGIGPDSTQAVWLICAYAAAIFIGMAAFVLPGGIGAREAAFIWIASPVLDTEAALALGAALRLVNVMLDLSVGAIGVLLAKGIAVGESR